MPNAPALPESAPFTTEQRAWLNGMVAALFSAPAAAAQAPVADEAPPVPATLLYGSQTGNAEGLAKRTAKAARGKGIDCSVKDLGSYEPADIVRESRLLLITSTYGDGEPPDNAKAFHGFIHAVSAPRLENLSYSVLGLGDSSYPDFNRCAREIDARLATLGATRLAPPVFCDTEFDNDSAAWQTACFQSLSTSIHP